MRSVGESGDPEVKQTLPSPAPLGRNRLSDNVGAVNCFLSTQRHSLLRKRHFGLVEKTTSQPTTARLVILSGQKLGPTHASLRSHSIMITSSNSSAEEEQDAHSLSRCSTAHHGDFRAVLRVLLGLRPAKSHENYSRSNAE